MFEERVLKLNKIFINKMISKIGVRVSNDRNKFTKIRYNFRDYFLNKKVLDSTSIIRPNIGDTELDIYNKLKNRMSVPELFTLYSNAGVFLDNLLVRGYISVDNPHKQVEIIDDNAFKFAKIMSQFDNDIIDDSVIGSIDVGKGFTFNFKMINTSNQGSYCVFKIDNQNIKYNRLFDIIYNCNNIYFNFENKQMLYKHESYYILYNKMDNPDSIKNNISHLFYSILLTFIFNSAIFKNTLTNDQNFRQLYEMFSEWLYGNILDERFIDIFRNEEIYNDLYNTINQL